MERMEMPQKTAHEGMSVEEMKETNRLQAVLAVEEYALEHRLEIDPVSVVDGGESNKKLRHDAGMMWALPGADGASSWAKRFKVFFAMNRDYIHAVDVQNKKQLDELLKRISEYSPGDERSPETTLH